MKKMLVMTIIIAVISSIALQEEKITAKDIISFFNLGNNKIYIKFKEAVKDTQIIKKLKEAGRDFFSICEDKRLLLLIKLIESEEEQKAYKENKTKFFKDTYNIDCEKEYIFSYHSEVAYEEDDTKTKIKRI
jgi:hypothetical protein